MGWFGYQRSQNDAEADATAETADDGPSVFGGDRALGEMPEVDQVLDLLDDEQTSGTFEAGERGTPPAVAGRSLSSQVRVYASAAPGATFAEFTLDYDLLDDNTMVTIHDPPDLGAPVRVTTSNDWYYTTTQAGTVTRTQRTPASLDPAPDTALAAGVTESMAVPDAARPYATPIALGGLAEGTITLQLDVAGFQTAAPEVFQTWLATWTGSQVPFPSMVSAEPVLVEQFALDVDWLAQNAAGTPRPDADVLGGVELPAAGTIVVFRVGDDGRIVEAAVRSVDLDFRIEWVFQGKSDNPVWLRMPAEGWNPAS